MPTTNLNVIPDGADTYPPKWEENYPTAIARDVNALVNIKMDEPGMAYVIAVAAGATAPTSSQVKAGSDYNGVTVVSKGNVLIHENSKVYQINLTGLTAETAYDLYVVAEDDEPTPNLQTDPTKLSITTIADRSLTMFKPKPKDTVYVNGYLHYEWEAKNLDSLYMGAGMGGFFFIISDDDDHPIVLDADAGSYDFKIPEGAADDAGKYFDITLFDAADTSFMSNVADSVLLLDAREVKWTSPQSGASFYVGDTVTLTWEAQYLDSVYIGGHDYTGNEDFIFEDDNGKSIAFDASAGSTQLPIPLDAETDSVLLVIFDAADPSVADTLNPIYIVDTIPPQIDVLVPENGLSDAPYGFTASIYFTESVNILGGKITLHAADGSVLKEYDLTGTAITHDDEMISFPLGIDLEPGKSYYFTMDADAVEDSQHNKFAGFNDNQTWAFTAAEKQPYFSEYMEGSSWNKALEIFNPTDHAIDLSQYAIITSYNGKGWQYDHPYVLHGTLQPGDVYTIFNPDFDFSLLSDSAAVVDTLIGPYLTYFNGDDARALAQLIGGSWEDSPQFAMIDIFGIPDIDPGSGWAVAGVSNATVDHTLIRKRSVTTGNLLIGWSNSAGTDADNSEWIVMPKNFVDNLGYPTPDASDNTTVTGVILRDTTGTQVSTTVTIDSAGASITVEVIYSAGHMVDSLVPYITVADNGSVEINGDTLDFTNPVTFTVTAEDGLHTRDWTLTVTVAAAPSDEAEILSFTIPGQTGETDIDATNHVITVDMPYGTDVSGLTPSFEVSVGATADPPSNTPLDFSDTVKITVTAEDGTTQVVWKAVVVTPTPADVGIYGIQYTTDPSGDSPYVDQLVKVSGIVTALNIYSNNFKGYYLQDTAAAWNGIYVYDPGRDSVKVGDSLTIVGTVTEYYGITEIKNVIDLTIISHDNTLPGPVQLTTGEAADEKWESVFVAFHNAVCTANDLGYSEVSVDDGSGEIRVDDYLYHYNATSDFVVNNVYNLQGIMYYSYGNYKLLPRSADDISDVTGVRDNLLNDAVTVYPNPSDGRFTITVTNASTLRITILNTLGKVVATREVNGNGTVTETFDLNVPAGFYFLRIEDGTNSSVKRIVIR